MGPPFRSSFFSRNLDSCNFYQFHTCQLSRFIAVRSTLNSHKKLNQKFQQDHCRSGRTTLSSVAPDRVPRPYTSVSKYTSRMIWVTDGEITTIAGEVIVLILSCTGLIMVNLLISMGLTNTMLTHITI